MPVPLELSEIDDTQGLELSATGGSFTIGLFVMVSDGIELGSLASGTNAYTEIEDIDTPQQVYLKFYGGTPLLSAGTYLTILWAGGSVDVHPQAVPAEDDIWYLDSNGVTFLDAALTLPVDDGYYGTAEDAVSGSDSGTAPMEAQDFRDDALRIGDTGERSPERAWEDTVRFQELPMDERTYESLESMILSDLTASEPNALATETLKLHEVANLNPDRSSESSETVTISEDPGEGSECVDSIYIQGAVKEAVQTGVETYGQISAGYGQIFHMITDAFDMGIKALKFIETVEIGHVDIGTTEVAIYYKFKRSDSWTSTPWIPVNDEGIGWVRIAGNEFRVAIRSTVLTGNKPDYVTVRWKAIDKRGIRGPYVQTS